MPIVFLAILPIYGQKTVHIFDEQGNKIFYSLDSSIHFFEFTSDVFEDQKNNILDSLKNYGNCTPVTNNIYAISLIGENYSSFIKEIIECPFVKYSSCLFENNKEISWIENSVLVKTADNIISILEDLSLLPLSSNLISPRDSLYKLSFPKGTNILDVSIMLSQHEGVKYSNPIFYRIINMDSYYSNPNFIDQWYLRDSTMENINILKAWDLTTGKDSIIIGVIDDGFLFSHPDLHNNIIPGENFTPSNMPFGQCDSSEHEYHGTKCAGVIAAENNNIGVVGVAHSSKLVPLKAFYVPKMRSLPDEEDFGNKCITNDEYLVDAFLYACDSVKIDVINCSWGFSNPIPAVKTVIDHLTAEGRKGKGIVICASSGNAYTLQNVNSIKFPAILSNVISVGASDEEALRVNRIWKSKYGDSLNLVAPGVNIMTTFSNSPLYSMVEGTSFAAPQVAATAALILSLDSTLTYRDVFEIICSSTTKPHNADYPFAYHGSYPYGTWNEELGYGLLNVHHALLKTLYRNLRVVCPDTVFVCQHQEVFAENFPSFPDSITFCWSLSPNLDWTIENDSLITVRGNSEGEGWVSFNIIHAGDTMPIQRPVVIRSTYPVIDTLSGLSDSITHPSVIVKDFYIDSLRTLVVTDTLHCAPSARIIVHPGGKLIVDGGTLTSACTGEMWQGVFVEGHRLMHQTPEKQGKVTLRNGAVIENALCAIRTSAPDGDSLSSGGIVFATNTTFRNNCKSVDFLPYADTIGDSATIGNLGSFTRCTFTVDDDNLFAANDTSFTAHATLWDVYGVSFLGCTFTNATTGATADRGYAIRAMDAGFHVATQCDTLFTDPEEACQCPENKATYNLFSGFQTAVQAGTTGNAYPLTVDEARFTNNGIGVSVAGNNHATVTRCNFDLDNCPGDVTKCTGLHLSGCTGYLVEENSFHRTAVSSPLPTEGIYVANSGTAANTLHRNSFTHLQEAVRVSGTNGGYHDPTGLELSCNTFQNDMCDIYVAVNSNMAWQQGSASVGADNSFAGTTGSSLYNAGNQTIDYYFIPGNNHLPYTPTNVNTRKSLAANACMSTLCNGGSNSPLPPGPIKSPDAGYLALKDQYDTLLAAYESRGYADIMADPSEDLHSQADIQSARLCFAQLAEVGRELYAQSYAAVRRIQGDTVLDLPALKSWFAATPSLSSMYSLAETEFLSGEDNTMPLQGISALLTTQEERDEYDNYMAFNALKESLSGSIPGHVNWPAATETQITELQRIAAAGTGRSSVMARGVLCFFFGICYDDEEVTAETRRATAKDGERCPEYPNVLMKLYPNPVRNTLHVEFEGADDPQGTLTVTNITGVVMLTRECHDPVTKLDVSHLAPGLYVVSFRNEKGVVVRKFVKL